MAPKKKEAEEVVLVKDESIDTPVAAISPLTQEFDKEDLNLLRDKINEIISKS